MYLATGSSNPLTITLPLVGADAFRTRAEWNSPWWFAPDPVNIAASDFSKLCTVASLEYRNRFGQCNAGPSSEAHTALKQFVLGEHIWPSRVGELCLLPSRESGILYVAFDIHEDFEAFTAVFKETRFIERVLAGEDLYLAFVGDYISRGYGGVEILSQLLQLFTHPKFGERILLLKGNHELNVGRTWDPEDGSGARPRHFYETIQRRIEGAWRGSSADTIWDDVFSFFDTLPHSLVTANGALVVHAGVGPQFLKETRSVAAAAEIGNRLAGLSALAFPSPDLCDELLNLRYTSSPNMTVPDRAKRVFADLPMLEQALDLGEYSVQIRGHQLDLEGRDRSETASWRTGSQLLGKRMLAAHTVTKGIGSRSYADAVVAELPLGRPIKDTDDVRVVTVLKRPL